MRCKFLFVIINGMDGVQDLFLRRGGIIRSSDVHFILEYLITRASKSISSNSKGEGRGGACPLRLVVVTEQVPGIRRYQRLRSALGTI